MRTLTAAAAGAVLLGQLAHAHTQLSTSIPAADAVLDSAPSEVMLHFSEAVRLTAVAVQKDGESKQSIGPLPRDAREHFVVPAPHLQQGRYTVTWRALSADTHVMTGEFAFSIDATATTGRADADAVTGQTEDGQEKVAEQPPHTEHASH